MRVSVFFNPDSTEFEVTLSTLKFAYLQPILWRMQHSEQ